MLNLPLVLGVLYLFMLFLIPLFAHAQVQISATLPNQSVSSGSTPPPGSFVEAFYQWALSIAGILAFGIIIFGGVKYMVSAGNPSMQGDAKEWIKAAILGVVLLACAYLILYTINPNLVNLGLPGIGTVGELQQGNGSIFSGPAPVSCPTCVQLPNCTVSQRTNCGGTPSMNTLVSCIDKSDSNFVVNEAYPPVVDHSDPGHNMGCAIDVHVSNCAAGSQFMAAAKACGASKVLNEYAGCGGTLYTHTTGGNIHIDAPGCP